MTHSDSTSLQRYRAKGSAAQRRTQALPAGTAPEHHALEFAAAADRSTAWPIHRIRCFLLTRQAAVPPRAVR